MFRWIGVCLCALCLSLGGVQDGHALGLGFYGDLAGGGGEAEWDTATQSFDIDLVSGGFGFALDTAAVSEKKFSYRLLLGFEGQTIEDEYDSDLDLGGLVIDNVFAFSLLRRPDVRLWAGPLVRIGFYSGETDTYDIGAGFSEKLEFDSVTEFGIGGVFGANFKVARRMILAPSVGFRYIGGAGEADIIVTDTGTGISSTSNDDLVFAAFTAFINLAVLFE